MRAISILTSSCILLGIPAVASQAQRGAGNQTPDPVRPLVAALTLDQYKSTIKGLTQFGDRREGTQRNRDAMTWIEAQLKSYGCSNVERITYQFGTTPAAGGNANANRGNAAAGDTAGGRGGNANAGRGTANAGRGNANAGRGNANAGRGAAAGDTTVRPLQDPNTIMNQSIASVLASPPVRYGRGPTGVNRDTLKQPDARIRALNIELPAGTERQEVYCTKIGTSHPEEMYIIGGHMDGHGVNEAVNDDGSGTALVMELARILNQPNVQTERSIRFALWNNEETGLNGARAYVAQRSALQGKENPVGSGKYPEPKWLGMIQHDMMMWDHGAPDSTGKVSPVQRKEADVNIEFSYNTKYLAESQQLAWYFRSANERYATDYPAAVGYRMSNTDSDAFKDFAPTISLRENERVPHTRDGWNPTWHQPLDVWSTFSDKDFLLGLNAAQTTLGAIAQLVGARVKP